MTLIKNHQSTPAWIQSKPGFCNHILLNSRLASTLNSAFWAGLFVTLFLFFIKPFGTQVPSGGELKFLVVCGYFGLVTVGITLIVNGLCLLLPGIFKEEKWTVWKEILFNLFFIGCVGLGNLMLANLLWEVPLNARTFWIWQGFTFAVGIFPTIVGAFFTQMKLSKKYAAEAALTAAYYSLRRYCHRHDYGR
jgi:hypothetical protein